MRVMSMDKAMSPIRMNKAINYFSSFLKIYILFLSMHQVR